MIVIYSLPNMLSLPYQIDREKGHYTFRPGENQVPDRIWEAIKSQNKARFDNYYSSIMWEVHLPPEAVNPTSSIDPPDEESAQPRYDNLPTLSINPLDEEEALSRYNNPPTSSINPLDEESAQPRYDNLPTLSINPPDEEEALSRYNNLPISSINPPDEGAAASGETLVDLSGIDQIRQDLDLIENTMGLEEPHEGYRERTAARLILIEHTMGLDEPGTFLHDEKHSERQLKRPGRAAVRTINGRMAGINDFAAGIREKKGTAKVNELVGNSPAHRRAPPRTITGHRRQPSQGITPAHRRAPPCAIAGHCRVPSPGTAANRQ